MVLLRIDMHGTEHQTIGALVVYKLIDRRTIAVVATIGTTLVAKVLEHLLVFGFLLIAHLSPFLCTELIAED